MFVEKNISKYSGLSVQWFGGEPLIAMDVIERLSLSFIGICQKVKKPYSATMTTNGYLLSNEVLQRLLDLKVYSYQITIDGVEATHNSQRSLINGQPTFEKITNNLIEIRNKNKHRLLHIMIRINLTKNICKMFDQFASTLYSIMGDDKRFSLSIQQVADWGGDRVKDVKDDMISSDDYGYVLDILRVLPYKFNYSSHYNRLNSGVCVCYANKINNIVVGSDGLIYKCTGNFEDDNNKIGRLINGGVMDIAPLKEAQWVSNIRRERSKCENCFFSGNCLSAICPAAIVNNISDIFCSYEMSYLGRFLELFDRSLFQEL
jgi:uncharacterized protein